MGDKSLWVPMYDIKFQGITLSVDSAELQSPGKKTTDNVTKWETKRSFGLLQQSNSLILVNPS